jgi:hypothetical protein
MYFFGVTVGARRLQIYQCLGCGQTSRVDARTAWSIHRVLCQHYTRGASYKLFENIIFDGCKLIRGNCITGSKGKLVIYMRIIVDDCSLLISFLNIIRILPYSFPQLLAPLSFLISFSVQLNPIS